MKEHEIRELVNRLHDIAVEYRDTQQLREHIAHAVNAAIKPVTLINEGNIQSGNSGQVPVGYALVPIEPTENIVVEGFESEPDEFFSEPEVWKAYQEMSGCRQAAHRARLCWAAMIAAVPKEA